MRKFLLPGSLCAALLLIALQILLICLGNARREHSMTLLKKEQEEKGGIIISTMPGPSMVYEVSGDAETCRGETPLIMHSGGITLEFRRPGFRGKKTIPDFGEGMALNDVDDIRLEESVPVLSTLICGYPLLALSLIPLALFGALRVERKKRSDDAACALPAISYIGEGGKIGSYRLEHLLGKGSMAEVFVGHSLLHGKDLLVAIKVLTAQTSENNEFRSRFEREVKHLNDLKHPHIVAFHEWGEESGRLFMVMEYIDGRSLADIIPEEGMAVGKALGIVISLLEALECAHGKNIIHRDLKPSNILLTSRGVPKIADFGLARSSRDETITRTDSTLGTPAYMPPEQIKGERSDARSDLYSVGCILFHMLIGTIPFYDENAMAIIMKHLTLPPPSMREMRPGIPSELDSVVMRLLEPSPEARFQSAGELSRELVRLGALIS
jgi:hypothetical protein